MEFSWNYQDVMGRLATQVPYISTHTYEYSAKDSLAYKAMFRFIITKETCEVPSYLYSRIASTGMFHTLPEGVPSTIVFPLYAYGNHAKTCSGAETMLKYFVRENSGRVNKVVTPKGEVYYGNNGLILDGEFNPLLVSTVVTHYDPNVGSIIDGYKIHLHPNVFIDDTKMLNKSLAKKGIAYYLSHDAGTWMQQTNRRYEVVIDDCSQFVTKAVSPDLSNFSQEAFKNLLRENIDEVLRQFATDDGRRV